MAKTAIITRTRDRNLLLERAINSVLSQTDNDWLHVIINDAGDKGAVEQLVAKYEQQYNGRLKLIHNETSSGMEAATNLGIKSVLSEYVVVHDDDDSWDKRFLEIATNALASTELTSAKGVVTRVTKIYEELLESTVKTIKMEPYKADFKYITLFELAAENLFPPIAFLFKREVLDQVGYYDESYPVQGDWDFNLRFLERFDIVLVDEFLANYHHREKIISGSYGNSVTAGVDKHALYEMRLKNELLRKDLESGKLGVGILVNLGNKLQDMQKLLTETHTKTAYNHNVSQRLFNNKLAKGLGKLIKN
jgi:glycosyltransferase involved in cell wall biosynthesis